MSARKPVTRLPRSRASAPRPTGPVGSRALLVIDHERLQRAAWAEFHAARRRLDRVARDLHRHEEVDVPAFTAWLHRQYPLRVTRLRELRDAVGAKTRQIRRVQIIAATTGRSPKRIWRDLQAAAAHPAATVPRPKSQPERDPDFGGEEDDAERRKDARPEDFETTPPPPRSSAARDIYRRLVQRLHPDRGGGWSASRQRLWHEVQRAWGAGDGDWLARLEVDWEKAHEAVGPTSALSRLRAAIEEVHAARRDAEAKLRAYRASAPWRFTHARALRAVLARRVEADFARDLVFLERQLRQLDVVIAGWEEDWTRADSRPHFRRRRPFRLPGRTR